jgi:hypothetical protein
MRETRANLRGLRCERQVRSWVVQVLLIVLVPRVAVRLENADEPLDLLDAWRPLRRRATSAVSARARGFLSLRGALLLARVFVPAHPLPRGAAVRLLPLRIGFARLWGSDALRRELAHGKVQEIRRGISTIGRSSALQVGVEREQALPVCREVDRVRDVDGAGVGMCGVQNWALGED